MTIDYRRREILSNYVKSSIFLKEYFEIFSISTFLEDLKYDLFDFILTYYIYIFMKILI